MAHLPREPSAHRVGFAAGGAKIKTCHEERGAEWDAGQRSEFAVALVAALGAAVSGGILLHSFGGFQRRRVLFGVGLASGIIGGLLL